MWLALRKLTLGMCLIGATSAVLLYSDWGRRVQAPGDVPEIAILQFASRPLLDENVRGMIDGLAEAGFADGETISIKRFNAQNDMPTMNAIAREMSDGKYDLIMTSSTPCLQAVANANKSGKSIHVFGAVTDPFGAGVGISREEPLDHPKHLVGIGTFQPVERTFELARELFPGLKSVGVVWNPAEACSEACTLKARDKCKELDIELLEATVDQSSGVLEAAKSLVARGAQALWVGGDNTVELAIDSLVAAAHGGKIPVFNNSPGIVDHGLLFGLGANYYEVGLLSGELAARVLKGADPAEIPVENVVPERLAFNKLALAGLRDPWKIPPELLAKADVVCDADGLHVKESAAPRMPQPNRTYKVGFVCFAPDVGTEIVVKAVKDGLRDSGFIEGDTLEIREAHAQGEIANIPMILQTFDNSDVDLIVTFTTPCLTAACSAVRNKPVVFTYVYDPIAAGAGKSRTDHLPHVTGVGSFPPVEETIVTIKRIAPDVKSVGTLYNSAEANSRKEISVARGLFEKHRIRLEEVSINNSNEAHQAAQVLCQKGIDVLWVPGDNTAVLALDAIVKVATKAKLPLVIDAVDFLEKGALVTCGIGFERSGYAGGVLAARVLLGEKPSQIPFEEIATKRVGVNYPAARKLGVTFPDAILREAELFVGLRSRLGRPAKVAMVQIGENPTLDSARDGVVKALQDAKLQENEDFVLKKYSASGETSQLPLIMSTINTEGADLVVTVGTPTLLAAVQAIRDIPIVFTVASDPKVLGILNDDRPRNFTGVYDDPPIDRLLALALEREPVCKTVGTVWDPSQPNSEISVKKLRQACKDRGLPLRESTAGILPELTDATQSLCARGADIIIISADNLTTTGFPAIHRVAQKNDVPIYTTDPTLVESGATAAIGDDFFEWGKQSGLFAARVLGGVRPASLPFEPTAVQRTAIAEADARTGPHARQDTAAPAPRKQELAANVRLDKTWKVSLVRYNDSPPAEIATKGVEDGFKKAKLIEGRDYTLNVQSAQGDIATLSTILSAIKSAGADMVMTLSTPTLQGAVHRFKKTPVVFTFVADGVVAGAGKSNTDHQANVTGITTLGDFSGMPPILKECMPSVRRVGTLFTPSEANSVHNKSMLAGHLKEAGIELVDVPVNSTAEVTDAALSLCSRDIDAVCQCLDNLTAAAFASIAKVAEKQKLPVFGFVSSQAKDGAIVVLARDYYDCGVEGALVAARVMRGANPANIPFTNLKSSRLVVNLRQARKLGVEIPESILRRADEVIE